MKLSHLFNSLPKRLATGAILSIAAVLPVAASASTTVTLEGSMGVANVTAGDTTYSHSVNAKYDQVVKFQVYYHNRENPDSGKNAENLRVKINIPSTSGKTQTQTATISADNSNTVTSQTTVNLGRSDAYLKYIPGSAVWKHNVGTNANPKIVEQNISDAVVTSGQGLRLENEKPCYNFAATVTVLARVEIPGVQITKQVEKLGQTNQWTTKNSANPGDTLKYLISYKNTGNTVEKQVILRDNLPPKMALVPGTTYLADASHPKGVKVSDDVTKGGINAGNFGAGATAFLTFQVKVPGANQLACGQTEFRNVGVVHPQGMDEFYNTAITDVNKKCETPKPEYSCNLLSLTLGDNRTVKANVTYTAKNGATYKSSTFDWGDGKNTSGSSTSASHQYDKDGTYNVVAHVTFNINGTTKTITSEGCAKPVKITTPAKPAYSCNLLQVTPGENRTVTVSNLNYTAINGATFKDAVIDWGDNSQPLTTNVPKGQSHQYAKDGNYTVSARVLFSVNGKDTYATSESCAQQVSFTPPQTPPTTPPTTPPVLPNTGTGDVIGVFATVVVASVIGYRLFLSRKLSR